MFLYQAIRLAYVATYKGKAYIDSGYSKTYGEISDVIRGEGILPSTEGKILYINIGEKGDSEGVLQVTFLIPDGESDGRELVFLIKIEK